MLILDLSSDSTGQGHEEGTSLVHISQDGIKARFLAQVVVMEKHRSSVVYSVNDDRVSEVRSES